MDRPVVALMRSSPHLVRDIISMISAATEVPDEKADVADDGSRGVAGKRA
jgi:hypothetical protein